jgi:integrase
MKAGRQHRIPISTHAMDLLRYRERHHLGCEFVFSTRPDVELSDMTLTKVLRDNRISSDVPGRVARAHGFRSNFRDWASKNAYVRDLAERALAHTIKYTTRPLITAGINSNSEEP